MAHGPDGPALLRWWAEPLTASLTVRADGRGGLVGALPAPRDGAAPGNALQATHDGARWVAAPGRGPWLGWVVDGAERWLRWPAGAPVRLTPLG